VSRRVGAWTLAAVVTVALVAGGVLVARGGRDRSPAVLPALDLAATGQAAGAADSARAAIEPAPAPGATEPAPAPGARGPAPAPGGQDRGLWPPVTYRLKGPLPTLPDRAQAWRLGDRADAGRLAALAAALGLDGRPTEEPSGWTVRDGRRALAAHRLAGVPWSYGIGGFSPCLIRPGPYRPGGARCLDPDAPVSSKAATVAPARPFPRPALPSRAEAERVARDLAARAGLSLDGAEVRVADSFATRNVTIVPDVAGRATSGFAWTVGVGAKGTVQHAAGWLATPEPADTYPLIGVAEGFERLKKAQPLGPLFRADGPEAVELDPCPAGGKVPCAAKPLPTRVATVTGVRLGLQLAPTLTEGDRPASVAYLLPAYLFDLEGGWTDVRAIIAVPDRYLTRP
jgi:hypothetical protein